MVKKDKNASGPEKEPFSSEIAKKFRQSPALYIGSVVILVLVIVTFLGGDLLSGGRFGSAGDNWVFGYYDKIPITLVPGNNFAQSYEWA